MTNMQAASWVLAPENANDRPGKGERLWLMVAPSGGALRVWGWQSAAEAPGEGWAPVSWRAEWDDVRGMGGHPALRQALAAAIGSAVERFAKARRAEAEDAA